MSEDHQKTNFPKHFMWGASTSGHQVDGDLHDQWTQWEKKHKKINADSAVAHLGQHPSLKRISEDALDPENYVSGNGVDHRNRFRQDFDILKDLNFNAFRFSIEWSEIEPREGHWNQDAIDHYRTYIAELRKRDINPVPNLWHWTHPLWFEKKGAFTKKRNIKYFERYVEKVTEELLKDISHIVIINEANNYASLGYITGIWPPQKHNAALGFRVIYNLVSAQKSGYRVIKKINPAAKIGVAHNVAANIPRNKHNIIQKNVARMSDYFWDTWFYRRIRNYQDYIGINFYMTNYWTGLRFKNPDYPINDLGWYMEPKRLYDVVMRLSNKFKKPIIVTENGVADGQDVYRKWWIQDTIFAMEKSIRDGARIEGYFHWSLLDNFEWAEGYWPKFGLVAVDRKDNMKRTIRPSARWFADKIQQINKDNS